jgi:hypothetical protein
MQETVQVMYFETEADMLSAIDWLDNNQTVNNDYVIQDQGLVTDHDYYFLQIWFASVSPQAVDYYNGVAALLYEPPPPDEDPEDPPTAK